MIAHIVACSTNNVIGRCGQIPWHLPEDLKRFRQMTQGNVVIMGHSTYKSIGRPLPKRINIVLSRSQENIPGVQVASSINAALDFCKDYPKIYIIGGGQVYAQTFEIVSHIFLTRVHQIISDGDAWYPPIPSAFEILETQPREGYSYITYVKKN